MRGRRSVAELDNGQREIKAPKSAAGKRTVSLPAAIVPDIREYLARYVEPGADGRVFVGAQGAIPRRDHFDRLRRRACGDAGVKGLHFHDLRHTGNTLAASTGAGTRELTACVGRSAARAALICQHGSAERDRLIADAVSGLVDKGRRKDLDGRGEGRSKARGARGGTTD